MVIRLPGEGRRRATPAHEKSMGSYELFAWRDAMAVGDMLDAEFGVATARRVFEEFQLKAILDFEDKNQQLIGDFIQKPEGQRPAFFKRCTKNVSTETQILFLTLVVIGILRAKAVMEIRDRFRSTLAPGRGNRLTTAALYDFAQAMQAAYSYAWPSEVFEAIGIDDGCNDSD